MTTKNLKTQKKTVAFEFIGKNSEKTPINIKKKFHRKLCYFPNYNNLYYILCKNIPKFKMIFFTTKSGFLAIETSSLSKRISGLILSPFVGFGK